MGVILFGAAGTVRWPAAWAFLSEMAVLSIGVGLWLARSDPALLAERLASPIQRDQKSWDKVFMLTLLFIFCAWFILMGLDAARYRWSSVPVWLQVAGAISLALCLYIAVLTFRENTYAAPVIKVQRDRGQKVITTGPYGLCAPSAVCWRDILLRWGAASSWVLVGACCCATSSSVSCVSRDHGRTGADLRA